MLTYAYTGLKLQKAEHANRCTLWIHLYGKQILETECRKGDIVEIQQTSEYVKILTKKPLRWKRVI